MSSSGYTVEITNLSPNATKKDVHDFFAFCGAIQRVEIVRGGEYACKAYVTFKNPHAVETAVILNGSTILDQPVCITECRYYEAIDTLPSPSRWNGEDGSGPWEIKLSPLAQDVLKTMAAKGKEAFYRFDESHHVSAKVAEVSEGFGLTNKISGGVEVAKYIDQRYGISGTAKRAAITAANSVVNSSYLSDGALWLSGALSRASRVAADFSNRGVSK